MRSEAKTVTESGDTDRSVFDIVFEEDDNHRVTEATSDIRLYGVEDDGPRLLPVPESAGDVHQIFDQMPPAVYSALRTFQHDRFLWLDAHLDRTQESMRLLGWDMRLDRTRLCRALQRVCSDYPPPDARVRFDVLRDPATFVSSSSHVLIALSPFVPVPRSYLEQGVRVEVARDLHRQRPRVKNSDWVIRRRSHPVGGDECYEYLLVDDAGRLLEGTSTNFFAVRDGRLLTAGDQVLEGITRRIFLRLADGLGISHEQRAVALDDLPSLEEAFITSAARTLVPVVNVAGTTIGDGRPGPLSRKLLDAYFEFAEREARPAAP